MELTQYFKSIVDEEQSAVVICDMNHKIIYMNPTACSQYNKSGGAALLGCSLLDCHNDISREKICKIIEWFQADKSHNRIYISHNERKNRDAYMIALRNEQGDLIGYYEKHEYRNRETEPFYHFE